MTNTTDPSKTPAWPAWPVWPFWLPDPPAPAASDDFVQPINPGWTFGNLISVTEQNSSAPDTERDIVSVESYGRQLGRVIDALAELIKERPKSAPQKLALNELVALRDKIEKIKSKSAERRLDRITADLAELRKSDKSEYRRLVQKQVVYGPKLSGRSRYGAPERRTQKMPLSTRRSFTRGTPRGLFGSSGLMAAHSPSVSS